MLKLNKQSVGHIVASLIADDMDTFSKMKKSELLVKVKELQVSNYLELTDETLQDLYDQRYQSIIDANWREYNKLVPSVAGKQQSRK